jgi:seryl-tRNA synthetase
MLDLKYVAQNLDSVIERLKLRGGQLDLGRFQELAHQRRELYIALESLSHKRNTIDESLKLAAREDPKAIESLRGEMRALSQSIRAQEIQLRTVEEELSAILLLIPNLPHESVPIGSKGNGASSPSSPLRPGSTSRLRSDWGCWISSGPPRCRALASRSTSLLWRGWSAP